MLHLTRQMLSVASVAIGIGLALAACGDTWEGAKKDTKDNVKATGEGIENAGKTVKKSVD